MPEPLHLIAHRGLSGRYPENTMAALRAAVGLGVFGVEFDVQQTKDGELVVIHDRDLKKLAGVDAYVQDLTYAELSRADVGRWFDPRFAGERVPRLSEVLEAVGRLPEVHLEIKQTKPPRGRYDGIEERVLGQAGGRRNVIVSSFDFPTLERVRRLDASVRIGWLAGVRRCPAELALARRLGAESIHISMYRASTRWVALAGELGLKVFVYTPNSERALRKLEGFGVYGAFTDRADLRAARRESLR